VRALNLRYASREKAKDRQLSVLKQLQNDTVLTKLSKREEPVKRCASAPNRSRAAGMIALALYSFEVC